MALMSVTLDTFHFERSPLNLSAPGTISPVLSMNNPLISVTAETSHAQIGPCGPVEQSVGDSLRHSTMAAWSVSVYLGGHSVFGYYWVSHDCLGQGVRVKVKATIDSLI